MLWVKVPHSRICIMAVLLLIFTYFTVIFFYFATFAWSKYQCLSLLLWLEERYETLYIRHPGFQKGAKPLLALDNPFPMELPENLFGDKWAFVQLPFSGTSLQHCFIL